MQYSTRYIVCLIPGESALLVGDLREAVDDDRLI